MKTFNLNKFAQQAVGTQVVMPDMSATNAQIKTLCSNFITQMQTLLNTQSQAADQLTSQSLSQQQINSIQSAVNAIQNDRDALEQGKTDITSFIEQAQTNIDVKIQQMNVQIQQQQSAPQASPPSVSTSNTGLPALAMTKIFNLKKYAQQSRLSH